MRYFVTFTIVLALCFVAQHLALIASNGRFTKSESNFFSSLGRIQAGAQGKPVVMVLGSSITGRLPDRSQGFAGWANMGCDGGSAVDVLRAMDEGILPIAPNLVIECNTLQLALKDQRTQLGEAMGGQWFAVGLDLSAFAAYARPSAFFYSKMLSYKIGGFGERGGDDLGVSSRPVRVDRPPSSVLSANEEELIGELTGILGKLRAKGIRATFVWLPPARKASSPPPSWIVELARRAECPYWDLGQHAVTGTVRLTDGVHMASPTAARAMRSLMAGIPH